MANRRDAGFLTVCGDVFDLDWVRDEFDAGSSRLSDYQQVVLGFCKRWLRGDKRFEIKTSGSTGRPKVIELRRERMVASARGTADAVGLQAGDRALVCLDVRSVGGLMMLVRGLVLGLELVVVEATRRPFAGLDERIDFVAMVPMQVSTTLAFEAEGLLGCGVVLIGGAAIAGGLEDRISRLKNEEGLTAEARRSQRDSSLFTLRSSLCTFFHTYGMTETVSHVALRVVGESDWFVGLPGVELGLDERGCLVVCGAMTGFEWVVTNDVVELVGDRFRWLGRVDNVINSGGVKVMAEVVEAALGRVVGGRRVFVRGVDDVVLGERVVGFVEGDEIAGVIAGVRPMLGRYEVPKDVYFVSEFCETGSGKVDAVATMALFFGSDEI